MQPQNIPKQCIIVGGRMGHGKSSFVKMLADPSEINKIQIGAGTKSVTTECALYRIKDSLLEGRNYYIIDTPGIDSKSNYLNSLKSLDRIIAEEWCNIVGIIYLLDLDKGKQIKRDSITYAEQFLSLLKIDLEHKLGLTVLVFTKWDRNYREKEKMKQAEESLGYNLNERGLGKLMERCVFWASEPTKDKKKYIKYQQSPQSLFSWQQGALRQHLLKASKFQIKYESYLTLMRMFQEQATKILLEYSMKNLQKGETVSKSIIRNSMMLPQNIERQKTEIQFTYNFHETEPKTFIEKIAKWLFKIRFWNKFSIGSNLPKPEIELQKYLEYQMKYISLKIIADSILRKNDLSIVFQKNNNILDLRIQKGTQFTPMSFDQEIKATPENPSIKIRLSIYLPTTQKIIELLEILIKQYYNKKIQ